MSKGGRTAVRVPRSGTSSVTTKIVESSVRGPSYGKAGASVKGTTLPKGGGIARAKGKK